MSFFRYVRRSLRYHAGTHLATAMGVAVATAVITGALLVGNSVRDSLAKLTSERLGKIDEILTSPHFFRRELATEVADQSSGADGLVVGACLLPQVTVASQPSAGEVVRRAAGVSLVAAPGEFWDLDTTQVRPAEVPDGRQVVINQALADELQVRVSDSILVRLPQVHSVAAETPFGRRDAAVQTLTGLVIVDIVPNRGLGRFSIYPSQQAPPLIFMDPRAVTRAMGQSGRINTILVARSPESDAVAKDRAGNQLRVAPQLSDFGVQIARVQGRFHTADSRAEQVAWEYWSITCSDLLWRDVASRAVQGALRQLAGSAERHQPVFTYLVNSMTRDSQEPPRSGRRSIPYSMVSALDIPHPLGPWSATEAAGASPLLDDEIVLNSWAAEDLRATVGDMIHLTYFKPETVSGRTVEDSIALRLREVIPLIEPVTPFRGQQDAIFDTAPSFANDPALTPEVRGVTDRESIAEWDPPFPFDGKRIRPVDDDYWDRYRTTPKAFVSLATGQRIWGSRFGSITSFRVPVSPSLPEQKLRDAVLGALRSVQREIGFAFMPVKRQGLEAAAGTTPFEYLFLGFSCFLLISALLMVALLVGLSLQSRRREMGLLMSVGWTNQRVRQVFWIEALLVTLVGGLAGLLLGIGYAAVMVHGLRTWWLAATVAPVVQLSVSASTLGVGLGASVVVCLAVARWSLRQASRQQPRELMTGTAALRDRDQGRRRRKFSLWYALLAVAVGLSSWGLTLGSEAQAGAFFGAGAIVLMAGVGACRSFLGSANSTERLAASVTGIAWRSTTRNVNRSVLIVGLVAAAVFLLVAVSAFRLSPTAEGTGGFDWIAECDVPIYDDLSDPKRLREILLAGVAQTADTTESVVSAFPIPSIVSLSVRAGNDASCRNLFQASQPRLIGISPEAAAGLHQQTPGFRFAGYDVESAVDHNPWSGLANRRGDDSIPVIIDLNTARYGLKLYGGIGQRFSLDYGQGALQFRVVGLLSNSILQGGLLIGSEQMRRLFPNVSGHQFFLIGQPEESSNSHREAIATSFETWYGDQGMDVRATDRVLAGLLAIQNTYLSTFQTLGGLGLLLGTIGLAIVEIRNILERRRELAVLSAVGFLPTTLRRLVTVEHFGLLMLGILVGVLASLVTVLPHQLAGQATPPLGWLATMLILICVLGWAVNRAASLAIRRFQLLSSLRND